MAEKKFVKGSEEWMLFQDYWNLCQSVWEPDETDPYWQEAVKRVEAFCEKYGTEFAKDLALALLNDMERRCKVEGKSISGR